MKFKNKNRIVLFFTIIASLIIFSAIGILILSWIYISWWTILFLPVFLIVYVCYKVSVNITEELIKRGEQEEQEEQPEKKSKFMQKLEDEMNKSKES
jgi:hypothetical protein